MEHSESKLRGVVSHFAIRGAVSGVERFGNGWINDTYRVGTSGPGPDYVLQRVNHLVFADVELVQENIRRVCDHIRRKCAARGGDAARCTLTPVPTRDGRLCLFDGESWWRMTELIAGACSYEQLTPSLACNTGRAFGDFHRMLTDLPGDPPGETIPGFHDMELRLRQLRQAAEENRAGRLERVRGLVDELERRAESMTEVGRLGRAGELPRRIVHGDTKVNNVLFDAGSGEVLCVIDLDTVMPGYVLEDFGDFVRSACNRGAEDDPEGAGVDMEIFRAFARGYVEGAGDFLTPLERALLPFGGRLLTYMQTVRFLTDYLQGDTYYKILRPEHNLDRSRAQFALLCDIERHEGPMNDFIAGLR